MAWSGCNTTSEFIELMNFGPGPMDIGCYIVTNGQYSVTIPPNTVIQPGKYYLISGQDILAKNCGNMDSAVTVDLNWNTCNCTNKPVPVTGDGFMQNGGGANEKVVLLDPDLNVIDAVSRKLPVTASASVTTANVSGACTSKTFDLDLMSIVYEEIGEATGVDNSYSRKVDGDCGWVKTTAISADASNKTGSSSSATYDFSTLSASECSGTTGSISIGVSAANVGSLFPMSYTLAHDIDRNNFFNMSDQYIYGTDNTAPSIDINSLIYGKYRITVASSMGCNLKNYDFFIFNCYGQVLPLKLLSFRYTGEQEGKSSFECTISNMENIKSLVLEESDGRLYKAVTTVSRFDNATGTVVITIKALPSSNRFYRLRMVSKTDEVSYSQVIQATSQKPAIGNRLWPNPATNKLNIEIHTETETAAHYTIHNINGAIAKQGGLQLKKGISPITLGVGGLANGIYQLTVQTKTGQPISLLFVKQ